MWSLRDREKVDNINRTVTISVLLLIQRISLLAIWDLVNLQQFYHISQKIILVNGIIVNGIIVNGIVVNGIVVNGIVVNGIVVNGIVVNGIVVKGIVGI
jgi:hypothetical protein